MRTSVGLAALAAFCGMCAAQDIPSDGLSTSRELAKQLASELKAALSGAMQTSPESAVAVCSERAPQISKSIAKTEGIQVGRTALRVRNPDNAPNEWQRSVLLDFQRRSTAGESLATMEFTASVATDNGIEHRYAKAIPLEPLCATCHGTQIAPSLLAAIKAKYPNDQATGFNIGELRGAVYVVRHEPRSTDIR